jgi:hypothetical protein
MNSANQDNSLLSAPIIVVGMHRSGTGLLSKILQHLDVNMGRDLSVNQESIFFQSLNKDALDIIGCNWRCIDFLPEVHQFYSNYQWLTGFVRRRLEAGESHFNRNKIDDRPTDHKLWGWKDPRNSLLLPIWNQIFPDAKIVHIIRDGRDAALSLLQRDIKRERDKDFFDESMRKFRFGSYFHLWEIYIKRIQQACNRCRNVYTLKYEDFLKNPEQVIREIAAYIELNVTGNKLESICHDIDRNRAYRYRSKQFAWITTTRIRQSLLRALGYK